MQLDDGAMQAFALTLDKMLEHAAKWYPNTEVVTLNRDKTVSRLGYGEVLVRAKRVSAALTTLGMSFGDRVATLAWNTQAHLECWYGIIGMGAACHTLNPRLTEMELAWMLRQSGAKILIVDEDLLPLGKRVLEKETDVQTLLVINADETYGSSAGDDYSPRDLETILPRDASEIVWGGFDERTPSGLCFTSGTTGAPKGVTYTHRANFLHTLRQLQADVSGLTSHDVVMPVVPMFHANAWGFPFSAPATGAKLVFAGRHTDGQSLAEQISNEGVTIAVGVPTVWLGLMDYLDSSGLSLPSLKRVMVGGAPMSPGLMSRMEGRGIAVQTSWGMTELSPLGTATPPGDVRTAKSAGRPALGIDLLLKDADGAALPEQRGVEGHLYCKGSSVVSRYFDQSEPATDDAGWFPTGDLALISEGGELHITGRSKDLIKSGGEWINPAAIEALISHRPDVAQAAVIGRADEKWGERPVLIVELDQKDAVSDDELLAPIRDAMSSWWVPDSIIRVDTMPLAPTGKIDKMRLREAFGTG